MYRKGLPALRHSLRRRSLTGGGPRDDEPGVDVGRRRRCSLLQTPRSSSSSEEEEEEEEEEELITSKRSRAMLRKHNTPKQVEPSSSYGGIRRSTRKRKVKFENVNDSWIVGNRAVRGYPDYLRSPRRVRVTRRSLRTVRYTSANDSDEDDDEVEEPDDVEEVEEVVEEEQTRTETNGTVGTSTRRRMLRMSTPRRKSQPPRLRQRVADDESGDDEGEGGNVVEDQQEEEEGGGSSGDEADGDNVPEGEDSFQDMYARVKRRRRAAAQQRRSPDSMSASENNSRGYSLRKTKPAVQRFQIAKPSNPFRGSSKKRRRRISTSSSSSSSSSSASDKRDRDRRDRRKKRRELVGKVPKQSKLTADTGPMTLDSSIRFSEIGGLQRHVNSLKEMILFPILYPDIFRKFGVTPPKGVLFHGPPGTGKTLMARALANECSQQGNRKVSFFMRKGADVLSKWVGESERQLRLLFEEAHQGRPSIIFFDELDGLAPVRSSKQDQIHSSIVCTLLALMDGLDNRGDIIIIGATNRIDSIDPALRRPGRFDRELHFPLPGVKERREILGIHAHWAEPDILNFMAERTAGYCGSDLRALCTESVIHSMQRVYPQIYHSTKKLLLHPEKVKVERIDFLHAFQEIVPSAKRHWLTLGRKMPTYLDPLLSETLATLLTHVGDVFPYAFNRTTASQQVRRSPRLLLVGDKTATSVLSTGLLYKFEHCSVLNVAFHTLYSEPGHTPEEVLKMVFKELPHQSGAILWFGDVSLWWNETSATVKATLESMLAHMDQSLPVLYLATSPTSSLATQVKNLFSKKRKEVYLVPQPTKEQREAFFRPLFRIKALKAPPKPKPKKEEMEQLLEAPPTPPPQLTPEEMQARFREEENTLRELRIFLRQICAKLARNKQFYMFSKPVDVEEVPDYLSVIQEPMDLETMMTKIDHHKYTCAQDFLNDIDLMCRNALEYNPDRNPADKQIRHRACYLQDTAYALIKAEMDSDFEDNCRKIRDDRKKLLVVETDATATTTPVVVKTEDMDVQSHDTETVESSDVKVSPGASGAMSSGSLKRKRHKSAWSKGLLGKKKRAQINGSNPSGSRASAEDLAEGGPASLTPTGQSTPQKNRSGTVSDMVSDGSHLDESRLLDNSLTMNGYMTGATEDTEEETTGSPKVVKIDRPALNRLLDETVEVTATRNGHDQLTDLYGSMSEVINGYKFKWDRTNLIQDLRKLLREFSAGETSSDDEGPSQCQQTSQC